MATIQPLWAFSDTYITTMTEPVLGPDRSRLLYPFRSLRDSGAILAGGSDWSVTSVNPLDAIEVAVTRRPLGDAKVPAWLGDQRLELEDALAAYTIRGAYVNFEEKDSGSLEPGKYADLVVLDRNLFEIPPAEIHRSRVLMTLFEGRQVYRATTWK